MSSSHYDDARGTDEPTRMETVDGPIQIHPLNVSKKPTFTRTFNIHPVSTHGTVDGPVECVECGHHGNPPLGVIIGVNSVCGVNSSDTINPELPKSSRLDNSMETEDLTYLGNDPGAVKHGNFINYYSFHSAKQRVNNFQPQMFPNLILGHESNKEGPLLMLDIGCNTGELTQEIYDYLKDIYPNVSIKILAIDIDPTLIERAKESSKNSDITFAVCNIMNRAYHSILGEHLHALEKKCFDLTFCFSVTMWIHLNNGDDGLIEFLKHLKNISATIIIEPQPWNCYRNAQRRVKKSGNSFALYDTLKIKSNIESFIDQILTQDNTHKKVYESPSSSWKRIIQSYQRVDKNN